MSATTTLPLAARVLLVGAGIDLDVYDTEIARIEADYDEKEEAA